MSPKILQKIAYIVFAANTLCVVLLFEVIIYRIPFVSIFIVIMGGVWAGIVS